MSSAQKGFSAGSIVTAVVMTVLLGVFSWVGNQTFENSKDKERIIALIEMQAVQTKRLVGGIDKLNASIESLNKSINTNRADIIRLQERVKYGIVK
ncbi:hypothetical protein [Hydrogenimonas sp.]